MGLFVYGLVVEPVLSRLAGAQRRSGPLAHFLFALYGERAVSDLRERLWAMLEPAVGALGYDLVELEFKPGGGGLLRLFIDTEVGIGLEDCERVSRQVSGLLDVEEPIPGNYTLEVSSPGLDRKLVRPEDFDRFVGHRVNCKLTRLVNGRRRLKGDLLRREDDVVVIDVDGSEFEVPLATIETARLMPDLHGSLKAGATKAD